jgi:superfamily II DNA helicase RecQ
LLGYFGEYLPENCNFCSSCVQNKKDTYDSKGRKTTKFKKPLQKKPAVSNPTQNLADKTVVFQKIVSTIWKANQQLNQQDLIDILRGRKTKNITKNKYQHLSTFGLGLDLRASEWSWYLKCLVEIGLLKTSFILEEVELEPNKFNLSFFLKGQNTQNTKTSYQKIFKLTPKSLELIKTKSKVFLSA